MSAPAAPATRPRRTPRTDRDLSFLVGNLLFIDALLVVGAASAWAVYESPWYLLTSAAAIVLATAIGLLGTLRRWSWWIVALVTAGAYLVAGVPLAAPTMITDPATILGGVLGVVTAPVTGWKNLLTLELPLGIYQTSLAPFFFLLLVLGVLAHSLALRSARLWVLAGPAALLVTVFGVVFGSSAVMGSWRLGPWELSGVWEAVVGLTALLAGFAWYVWRSIHARRAALRAARRATGAHGAGRANRTLGTRIALSAGMLAIGLIAGLAVTPWAVAGSPRDVLRTAVDPEVKVRETLSPLADYRNAFADDRYDEVLFTVSTDEAVDRVRLATLGYFDGRVMRATDPTGTAADATAYTRVPSALRVDTGREVQAEITIGAYEGIWVPTTGELVAIDFEGSARSALADGFFYNAPAGMGVELASPGLTDGVAYTQTGAVGDLVRDPATLTPAQRDTGIDPAFIPESLGAWIEAQDAPSGGAGLSELISRLRARGLLSHALSVDPAAPPTWMSELGEYTFEPSRAGHSTDRIGTLFTQLLDKQNETGGDDDALLVAAAGDDEQFAVAGAMIADRLGFPSRVVLGVRLSSPEEGLTVCDDGACTGGDLSAWIEVQDIDGTWTAIDTTPQHDVALSPDIQQRRDPQNMTEVEPEQADTVLPPEADPADSAAPDEEEPDAPADLGWLWTTLRISGIVVFALLVLSVPAIAVLLAKLFRRRSRRNSPDPVDRVVGGWEEYLDTAVDRGYRVPRTGTRSETAAAFGAAPQEAGGTLAAIADRSVFGPSEPSEAESTAFWSLIDAERERFDGTLGWWARWKARLSLRSFGRGLRETAARVRGGRS